MGAGASRAGHALLALRGPQGPLGAAPGQGRKTQCGPSSCAGNPVHARSTAHRSQGRGLTSSRPPPRLQTLPAVTRSKVGRVRAGGAEVAVTPGARPGGTWGSRPDPGCLRSWDAACLEPSCVPDTSTRVHTHTLTPHTQFLCTCAHLHTLAHVRTHTCTVLHSCAHTLFLPLPNPNACCVHRSPSSRCHTPPELGDAVLRQAVTSGRLVLLHTVTEQLGPKRLHWPHAILCSFFLGTVDGGRARTPGNELPVGQVWPDGPLACLRRAWSCRRFHRAPGQQHQADQRPQSTGPRDTSRRLALLMPRQAQDGHLPLCD